MYFKFLFVVVFKRILGFVSSYLRLGIFFTLILKSFFIRCETRRALRPHRPVTRSKPRAEREEIPEATER